MLRILTPLLVPLVAAFVAGCVTTPEMVGRAPSTGDGKAVMSIDVPLKQAHEYWGYGLKWRAVGGKGGDMTYAPSVLSLAEGSFRYSGQQSRGMVYVLSLPTGEYEIYNVGFYTYRLGSQDTLSARTPFSIRFHVEGGKVTYVGSFSVLTFPEGAGLFCWQTRETTDFGALRRDAPAIEALPRLPMPYPFDVPPFIRQGDSATCQ